MRIDEISLADLTPLGVALRRHLGQGRFIHFSKQKNRFGVNPRQHHLDPPGVYFYPIDWLWNHEDFHDNQQFGTNWPYFFICDINFAPEGLNLDAIRDDQFRALGQRNGWLSEYEKFDLKYSGHMYKSEAQKFWNFLKSENNKTSDMKFPWLKSLRGMRWIKDSRGIIMSQEPEQVCVIDPRAMSLVESGEQGNVDRNGWETWGYWRHAVKTMFTRLSEKHGGTMTWKNKMPTWTVSNATSTFSVEFTESYSMSGLMMNWTIGRSKDSVRISTRVMKDATMKEVLAKIDERLSEVQSAVGDDLTFTPIISIEEGQQIIQNLFDDAPETKTEITNSSKMIWITGETERGHPRVSTVTSLRISNKEIGINVEVKAGGTTVASVRGANPENFESALSASILTWADVMKFHPTSDHYLKINADRWDVYLGWLYVQTGLKALEKYEENYLNAPDKSDLYGQLDRVFSRFNW